MAVGESLRLHAVSQFNDSGLKAVFDSVTGNMHALLWLYVHVLSIVVIGVPDVPSAVLKLAHSASGS